jgi:hypothetical protein
VNCDRETKQQQNPIKTQKEKKGIFQAIFSKTEKQP